MKITKETFTIKISEILKLNSFIHFKISTKKNNCLYKFTLTPTQIFYFLQKGTSNKCAILYIEDDSLDESLNSDKYRERFLSEKEFNDFFRTYFDNAQ